MTRLVLIILTTIFFTSCAQIQTNNLASGKVFDIHETNLAALHNAIQDKVANCEQITRAYIKRIKNHDKPTGINSIILINPNALKRARQLDKHFEQTGTQKALHCAPVILKDNFDTADMPTEAGAIALKGSIPPDDAFMVKKLRDAGAIIIAKSNMAEWAFSPYQTISSTHGVTRNAYDTTTVPAGSSGGTASAIAANFGIIGMGTDTGNSIRGPASHLALVGIRSTIGATSRDGVVPLLLNRDIAGPLTRTVEDAAKTYNVIAGFDPNDPSTIVIKDKPVKNYTKFLKKDGLKNVRLGLLRQLYDTVKSDPEYMALMDLAIKDLEAAGATIVDPFKIDNFETLRKATGFCSRFRFDLNNYLQSLGTNAPVANFEEILVRKLFDKRNIGAMNWASAVNVRPEEQEPPCVDVAGDSRRSSFLNAVLSAMVKYKVDAIIYPSWSNPPRKIGDTKSAHGNNSPVIAPHTGQPAITVPMGFNKNGLPAGLQILGAPFDEHKLFQYAYAYEQFKRHRKPPVLTLKQ